MCAASMAAKTGSSGTRRVRGAVRCKIDSDRTCLCLSTFNTAGYDEDRMVHARSSIKWDKKKKNSLSFVSALLRIFSVHDSELFPLLGLLVQSRVAACPEPPPQARLPYAHTLFSLSTVSFQRVLPVPSLYLSTNSRHHERSCSFDSPLRLFRRHSRPVHPEGHFRPGARRPAGAALQT
jgi:hypothetical protein